MAHILKMLFFNKFLVGKSFLTEISPNLSPVNSMLSVVQDHVGLAPDSFDMFLLVT